jgi:hypothetical protein
MAKTEKPQCAPIIPDLNRPEVRDRKTRIDALDFNCFARLRCALRLWDFFTGDKGGHFYKAEFVVLAIEPDLSELAVKTNGATFADGCMTFRKSVKAGVGPQTTLRVGERCSLLFPVARAGTATDVSRADRDDETIANFVATIYKQKRGPGFDGVAALKELNEKKKFDHDFLQFDLSRRPSEVDRDLTDPETGAVLKTYKKVFSRDNFEIVAAG